MAWYKYEFVVQLAVTWTNILWTKNTEKLLYMIKSHDSTYYLIQSPSSITAYILILNKGF